MIEVIGFVLVAAFVYSFYIAHSKDIKVTTTEIEDLLK